MVDCVYSVLFNSMILGQHFRERRTTSDDVARSMIGTIAKEKAEDRAVFLEYCENVLKLRKEKEWQKIRERYPFLKPSKRPLEGPGEVPLPMPSYHRLVEPIDDELVLAEFPKGIDLDHCWVYLLKGTPAAPTHIIAQGTLDARMAANGFRLLGAALGDTVVFISKDNGVVYRSARAVSRLSTSWKNRVLKTPVNESVMADRCSSANNPAFSRAMAVKSARADAVATSSVLKLPAYTAFPVAFLSQPLRLP